MRSQGGREREAQVTAHGLSGLSPSEMGPERDGPLPEVTQQAWSPGSYLFASLPPSAFRVFLLRLQEMGKGEREGTLLPVTRGPIFAFLSSSVCFPTANGGSEGERGRYTVEN